MSLRFNLSAAEDFNILSEEYRKYNTEGKFLLSSDVLRVLLEVREMYEGGYNSTRFDKGAYGAIQRVIEKLDL